MFSSLLDRRYDDGAGQLVAALRHAGELAAGQAGHRTEARQRLTARTRTLAAIAANADALWSEPASPNDPAAVSVPG